MRPSDAQDMSEEQPAEKPLVMQGIYKAFAQTDDAEPPRVPVTSELASYIRAASKPPPPPHMGDTAIIASSLLSQQYEATLAQIPTHMKVDEHLDRQRVHQAKLAGILASNATLSPIMSKEQVTRLAHHVTIRRNLLQHMCRMLHAQELDAAQYDAKASLLFAADEMVVSPKMGDDLKCTSYTTTSTILYPSTNSITSATSYSSTSSTPPPKAESIVMSDETSLMRMSEAEAARQRALAAALATLPVLPAPAAQDQNFGDIHSFDQLTPSGVTSSAAKVILQELEELGIEELGINELGIEELRSMCSGLSRSGSRSRSPLAS